MHKEVIEAIPRAGVDVTIVWLPMLEGDDQATAQKASRMFGDPRIRQFYDPQRVSGLTFAHDVFPTCLRELLGATPRDHPLYAMFEEWAADNSRPQPVWDAVFFFDAHTHWGERAPMPAHWSKQVAFHGAAAPGEPSAFFIRDDCRSPPVDSDWYKEVRNGLHALLTEHIGSESRMARIELLGFPGCRLSVAVRRISTAGCGMRMGPKVAVGGCR